jgi:hypothetical protein
MCCAGRLDLDAHTGDRRDAPGEYADLRGHTFHSQHLLDDGTSAFHWAFENRNEAVECRLPVFLPPRDLHVELLGDLDEGDQALARDLLRPQ